MIGFKDVGDIKTVSLNPNGTGTDRIKQVGGYGGGADINYAHQFTIGRLSNNYGFQDTQYGTIDPQIYEGDTITNFRQSTGDNNLLFALAGGQISGVSNVHFQLQGLSHIVEANWSISSYSVIDPLLMQFFIDHEGETVGLNIAHF